MTQAFYRKWRPQRWDEVVSQEHIVQTLRNAVRSGRVGHAYLLTGPRGTGKTTIARLLAKAINCLDPDPANRPCDTCQHCLAINEGRFLDLVEIDAASNTSVEDVRDLRDKINYRPSQGEYKVYIIDEVHMLSTAAFNALLKTLEEPPPHAKFILATTEVHKIPATILSRVQRYDFRRIPVEEIKKHLARKAKEEGLKVDDDALTLIARQATGAMRDAISLLDQLASTGDRVTLAEAQTVLGTATSGMVIDMIESIIARDAGKGMTQIQAALDQGTDARQFARQVVDYLRNLLLVRMGNANQVDATREMRQQLDKHARAIEPARLLEIIRLFNAAATDSRSSWHPGLALEMALAEAVEEKAPAASAPATSAPATAQHPANQAPARPEPTREPVREPARQEPVRQEPVREPVREPAREPVRDPEPQRKPPAQEPPKPQPPQAARQQGRQPPAQAAQAEPPAAPAGGKAASQQDLQQQWPNIKRQVKKRNPMTEGLLNSARSVVLKGDTLVLGFQSEVVKSKMETQENLDILRQAMQTVLGASMAIRCAVVGNKSASPSDLDVDGDGMVGTALDLGGKIVFEE